MSYVVWDGDKCVIFNSRKRNEAWDYVQNNKSMSEDWQDWVSSLTAGNCVAVINQFDTKVPYGDAPKYLQPERQL